MGVAGERFPHGEENLALDSCRVSGSNVAPTSVFEVCGLSTMNQEKAADLHSRSAQPAFVMSVGQPEEGAAEKLLHAQGEWDKARRTRMGKDQLIHPDVSEDMLP